MTIEFFCPSGHKLKAPSERAGKAGKCPKCGVDFMVPPLEEDEAVEDFAELPGAENDAPPPAAAAEQDSDAEIPDGAVEAGSGKQNGLAAAPTESGTETITFLCPNGHKLTSPSTLQGKAGKCPHCGERFRVPLLEELEQPDEEEIAEFGLEEQALGGGFDEFGVPLDDDEIPEDVLEEEPGVPHPMRRLFERLWGERDHGGKLRITIADAPPVEADFYARRWSQSTHAVFASRDEAGNYRIAAVAWDDVRRVEVDELVNLPEDVFE